MAKKPATKDALTILNALRAELVLFTRTGQRVNPGMVALWLSDLDTAIAAAEKCQS